MNVRLVVLHLPLERTTPWIPNRQARKSRNPCPNCNESRFPGISRILFPAKIFCVSRIPHRILVISRIPKMPFQTLSYGEIARRFNLYLWTFYCSTHADALNAWRSPKNASLRGKVTWDSGRRLTLHLKSNEKRLEIDALVRRLVCLVIVIPFKWNLSLFGRSLWWNFVP